MILIFPLYNKDVFILFKFNLSMILTRPSRAEGILMEAVFLRSGMRREDYIDNKYFTNINNLLELISSGAKILNLNCKQIGGSYYHQVLYRKHTFISITKSPYNFNFN